MAKAKANGSGDSNGNNNESTKKKAKRSHDEISAEILSKLDIIAEYEQLGVVFAGDKPRSSGSIECYAFGRDETKPSAFVNTRTGRYHDSGGEHDNFSLWEFAARFSPSRFPNWQAARKHYANIAGVRISTKSRDDNPLDSLEFYEWTEGDRQLAEYWCLKHKPGCSFPAIKAAGGRIVKYRCWNDKETGERRIGKFKCIALPCYGELLTDAPAVAWVLWGISGQPIEVYRGKGKSPDFVKMVSVGPTAGTLMNEHACKRLALLRKQRSGGGSDNLAALNLPPIELIHKTAGPSDMLAMMASLPPDRRTTHLVTTNASGEGGDVPQWVAELFDGLKVFVTHDADQPGELGAAKWLVRLAGWASEVRQVRLPYEVREKAGLDLRHWVNERRAAAVAMTATTTATEQNHGLSA